MAFPVWRHMGGNPGALRATRNLLQRVRSLTQSRSLRSASGSGFHWLQWRVGDDRFHLRARPPTWCDGQKGRGGDRGMGRSRGGLTSKLHALVDVDGRPVSLRLTGGQVHDACEAEALIQGLPQGATPLGDKGYGSNAIREAAAARNGGASQRDTTRIPPTISPPSTRLRPSAVRRVISLRSS